MRPKKTNWQRLSNWLSRFWKWLKAAFTEDAIPLSLVILLVSVLLLATLYGAVPNLRKGFWPGVYVEVTGMMFDVLIFGIFVAVFVRLTGKRREITHQQQLIDDFKKWDSDEARFRIAGAIRRMNRLGKTAIDFGGIELRFFSFRKNDIRSIKGSTFYDGTWGEAGSRDNVLLENVDFSGVNCRDVIFSKFNFFSGVTDQVIFALLKNCNFFGADLRGALFRGATLEWTENHPDELFIQHDRLDGPPDFEPLFSVFSEADLKDASFAEAVLKNADFRGAENILECDFVNAKGVETCLFDDEDTKNAVIEKTRSDSI